MKAGTRCDGDEGTCPIFFVEPPSRRFFCGSAGNGCQLSATWTSTDVHDRTRLSSTGWIREHRPPLCGPTQIIAPVAPSSRREQAIFSFGSIGWPTRPDNIGSVLYTDCERMIDLWKCLRANSSSWSSTLRFLSFWFTIIKRRARRKTTHSSPSKSSQHYPWLQLKQVVIPLHDQMFRSTKISNFESVNSQLIILCHLRFIFIYIYFCISRSKRQRYLPRKL